MNPFQSNHRLRRFDRLNTHRGRVKSVCIACHKYIKYSKNTVSLLICVGICRYKEYIFHLKKFQLWKKLASLWLEGESFFALEEVDDDDFILASSAIKAGARVLTTAFRLDSCVRDWTAGEIKMKRQTKSQHFADCKVSHNISIKIEEKNVM